MGLIALPEFDGMATDAATCEVLAALVRLRRPKVVVEAGTYRGHSALLMADACRRNDFGHVYTYDPHDHGLNRWLVENSLTDWCTYIKDGYTPRAGIEFAFIDASLDGDDVTDPARIRHEHFFATLDHLTPNGIVCAHDTRAETGGHWRDGEGGKSMDRIREASTINFDLVRGLSIYYKDVHARASDVP